jgi:RNA 3'-terminal phosphate cyclase (GTP)
VDYLDIDGDYLEGGGQILRTAVSLSVITHKPIRVYNIRKRRPKTPGLKAQHFKILEVLKDLAGAKVSGLALGSEEVKFVPQKDIIANRRLQNKKIDIGTAGAIGLVLQSILLVAAFKFPGIFLNIIGGTCGLGAIPVDYYPNVIFPLLRKSGLKAQLKILRRGYYPKGGGEVSVSIDPLKYPQPIELTEQGNITRISGMSIASKELMLREVAQRQTNEAKRLLKEDFSCPIDIKSEYVDTYSVGSEINLYAYTNTGCILGADARGELKKTAETVGFEAAAKLKKEILSGAACDLHLADNLIPWLSLLGGKLRTQEISPHTQTNIWVCEQFFGKIFKIEGNIIEVNSHI